MKMFQKIIGCSTVAAALGLSASTTQAQNLLTDPSFNGPFVTGLGAGSAFTAAQAGVGWNNYFGGSVQAPNDMTSSPDSPRTGSYALLAANAPANAWNPQGTYQLIANSSVGSAFSASIYALTDTGLLGASVAGAGPVDFQVQFFDSTLANISTIETGWSAIAANNVWQQYTVTGTVPVGTAYIAVYDMAMIGATAPSGTVNVFFDDASLTVAPAPEPTTLALAGLGGAAALSLIRRRKA